MRLRKTSWFVLSQCTRTPAIELNKFEQRFIAGLRIHCDKTNHDVLRSCTMLYSFLACFILFHRTGEGPNRSVQHVDTIVMMSHIAQFSWQRLQLRWQRINQWCVKTVVVCAGDCGRLAYKMIVFGLHGAPVAHASSFIVTGFSARHALRSPSSCSSCESYETPFTR